MNAPLDDLPKPNETPFRIEAAEDLLGLPDPDWLVNGIIQRNTLALIYGPSGCGKSFLALDLAHHLALGRPWFGHEVDQWAGVLYVAAEASGGIVKRVKAFRQHHEIAKRCPLWFIRTPVNLLNPATVDRRSGYATRRPASAGHIAHQPPARLLQPEGADRAGQAASGSPDETMVASPNHQDRSPKHREDYQ